ncbi:hypothetical protein [Propioniciclava soli]|uniref:hypothetical protein n=1 Tax=Propioniciclava soli TaxID=2775081 RepID=UPI001E2B8A6E|nr:hypothetical protein [Propioniciclava soli]
MTRLLTATTAPDALPPPGFTWSRADADAALAVLADPPDVPRDVVVLTDEEIVALDGLQNEQPSPTPWLDAQDLTAAQLGGIALRGLIARSMVALGPAEAADGSPTGELRLTACREITGVLMLRRTAQTVLHLSREGDAGARWVFAYAHHGRGVLIEDVDPNGLHAFGATTAAGAAEYLRALANPEDAPGAEHAPVVWGADAFASLTAWPAPFDEDGGVASLALRHHGRTGVATAVVHAGRAHVGLLRSLPDGRLEGSGLTDAGLRDLLHAALRGEDPF